MPGKQSIPIWLTILIGMVVMIPVSRKRRAAQPFLDHPGTVLYDVVDFAETAARRVYDDHVLFRRDHACGAFRYWNSD